MARVEFMYRDGISPNFRWQYKAKMAWGRYSRWITFVITVAANRVDADGLAQQHADEYEQLYDPNPVNPRWPPPERTKKKTKKRKVTRKARTATGAKKVKKAKKRSR